ncbi:alpha/beta fold hydrolase [Gallaecimonas kandeliae]|uniref:alpha/beta fold hydrolase n=1 Tax=Gallaecimonas kandeliae TaxID=3029055 RepID=UPI002648765D|nr:alpha/beta fold hydrolase [Gallaecimonas kandeliae]WKE64926.1 alpha/beta fold hydrolase [Gallaecimonas kandeliae]
MTESLFVPVQGHRLHLRRQGPEAGQPVLMLHGAISNGRTFYSDSGKGLGPFLAEAGFCVYVADLRGRGLSEPRIGRDAGHGQLESIRDDIPALQAFIQGRHGGAKVHWLAHSWGGVLMASTLARFPALADGVESLTFFGSKRSIRSWSLERLLKVELVWKRLAPRWVAKHGYLPARAKKIGADDETAGSLAHSIAWVNKGPWVDPQDGFDYGKAAAGVDWPRTWLLAGKGDKTLGNPKDVALFQQEMKAQGELTLLGRSGGFRRNYDHLNMLVGEDAATELYPLVLAWLRR